jgi:hypothetical protein
VFRLHITPKEYEDGIKPLIHKGFFVVASGVLAECYQVAIPETERETETKTETKKKATVVAAPEGVSLEIWDSFVKHRKAKKAPITPMVMGFFEEQANIAGWTLENALKETCVRGWQSFKAEWVAPKQSFAQQAADVARTTVPGSTGLDPVLVKIEADRKNAVPMPEHIRQQINQVLRKVS